MSGDFSGEFSGDGRVMSFDFDNAGRGVRISPYEMDMRLNEWWLPKQLYNPRVQHNAASPWFNLEEPEVNIYWFWSHFISCFYSKRGKILAQLQTHQLHCLPLLWRPSCWVGGRKNTSRGKIIRNRVLPGSCRLLWQLRLVPVVPLPLRRTHLSHSW